MMPSIYSGHSVAILPLIWMSRPSYLFTIVVCFSSAALGSLRVGSIRWDAWTGTNTTVGLAVTNELNPQRWHYRLPFFGNAIGANSVTVNGSSLATMKQEIAFAGSYGIDFWAFVTYPLNTSMSIALNNYISVPKPDVKMALIVEGGRFATQISIDRIVGYMKLSRYETIKGPAGDARPLFILLSPVQTQGPSVSSLRMAAAAAGLGNPYVVVMSGHGVSDQEKMRSAIGADGLGEYMHLELEWANKPGTGYPFESNAAGEQSYWQQVAALGSDPVETGSCEQPTKSDRKQWHGMGCGGSDGGRPEMQKALDLGKLLAPLTAGWDPRPREILPVPWGQSFPSGCKNETLCWVVDPTMAQLTQQAAAASCFLAKNPQQPQVALVSAWNEIDEGHWIVPSLQHGTAKLQALQAGFRMTDPCSAPGGKGIPGVQP